MTSSMTSPVPCCQSGDAYDGFLVAVNGNSAELLEAFDFVGREVGGVGMAMFAV